jgi:hypothetical protein
VSTELEFTPTGHTPPPRPDEIYAFLPSWVDILPQ